MHLNNKVLETHLSTPISQTFALIAGDCNHTVLTSPIDDPPADRGFAAAAASGLTRLSYMLAADCDLLVLRKSMDQLGGIINGNDPRPLRTVCSYNVLACACSIAS